MWLMTQHGFYSIVKNARAEDEYFVRARVEQDLENLKALMGWKRRRVMKWATADYRFRLIVSREEMLDIVSRIGEAVDYSNFKGRIHDVPDQSGKSGAYARIWGIMEAFQHHEVTR